jgi:hypothetical protein
VALPPIKANPREAGLPKWAQQELQRLRDRVQYGNEPLLKEVVSLRPKVALLQAKNDALTELLACAAKGGHVTAQDIMEMLEGYDLVLRGLDE